MRPIRTFTGKKMQFAINYSLVRVDRSMCCTLKVQVLLIILIFALPWLIAETLTKMCPYIMLSLSNDDVISVVFIDNFWTYLLISLLILPRQMNDITAIQNASYAKKFLKTLFALKWCFNFFRNYLVRLSGGHFNFGNFLWFQSTRWISKIGVPGKNMRFLKIAGIHNTDNIYMVNGTKSSCHCIFMNAPSV